MVAVPAALFYIATVALIVVALFILALIALALYLLVKVKRLADFAEEESERMLDRFASARAVLAWIGL